MERKKYLAFDIETAKILPDDTGELLKHRPLGICCIGAWASDEKSPHLFYSTDHEKKPADEMSQQDISKFVDFLIDKNKVGYSILSWNGLGFDFDVLAEESDRLNECKQLATQHIDAMFHIFCVKGFPVSLDAAAKAIGKSKSEDIEGAVAPKMWKERKHNEVLDYVAQDCRLTLDVVLDSEERQEFSWLTRRELISSFELPRGWLSAAEAMNLPLPDTSWMDKPPWSRQKFTRWLERQNKISSTSLMSKLKKFFELN